MFRPRTAGVTLRRGREDRAAEDALYDPHPGDDRFDPDFRVAIKCNRCGKRAYGPRRFIKEALDEHKKSHCPARHTKVDMPIEAQITYPKQ